jgi:hypothetical protein
MAQERQGAAKVIAQEGESVQVEHRGERLTVPMRGFPPGFKLRPGGRVILFDEPSGPVARPLVRPTRARLPREAVETRGALVIDDQHLEIQESTVVDERQPGRGAPPSDEYDLWIVERAEGEPTDQVIAVRRRI